MPYTPPVMLTIRTREYLQPDEGEPRQVVEVLHGDKVLGQLPVERVVYEMLPESLGHVTVTIVTERTQIETLDMEKC